jgi:hypothetical protein
MELTSSIASLVFLDLVLPVIICLYAIIFLSALVIVFSTHRILENSNLPNSNITTNEVKKIDLEFSQDDIIKKVKSNCEAYPLTQKINKNFDGLCDLLCNYITEYDLLQDKNSARAHRGK